ncbi:MAG: protein translocase subunit SecD [Rhodothermales bacterium]|nr:protein translocase subunit SecD [Rhodothermales bacterium]
MQGNGFKIFLTVFFLLVTGYYLWPSAQNLYYNQRIGDMEVEARQEYERENFARLREVKEKALKLGLDLLGGMHVTLEVGVESLIRELSRETDEVFEEVLTIASGRAAREGVSVIDAFVDEFESRDENARLSRYFRNDDEGITRRSTNVEVASYLRGEADAAVTRAIEIIRDRVDRYGVTEPSIQKQGSRRVIVEMPGIDDPERIRKLLKGTARLEFRLMADPQDVVRSLQGMIEYYEESAVDTSAESATDAAAADTLLDISALLEEEAQAANALLEVMQPVGQGVVYGAVAENDTAAANTLLRAPEIRALLPSGIKLMYTSSPIGLTEDGHEMYYILGVRDDIEMTGEVIEDARVDFDQITNAPEVTMVMNSEGARTWARLTGANVGKQVAIVLDGVVYSYPVVNERITGGRSAISGLDSQEEAQDIVTILKSGALPAPVEIVEERTVGPSLGQASIRAGFLSVMVGLLIVALFMIAYYRTGGVVADLALVLNIIFILGILAGFGATLTLPGIAGIVLTIGMAVDANVLIFERIREEQTTGKTLKAAIDGGFAKALSAIVDANITTFFVGAILYSFGVGPIQGFAVTLMAGILASMFSAIVFTRIIFDYMVIERRLSVNYG